MLRDVIAKQNKVIRSEQELERSQIMLDVLRKISPEASEDTEDVGNESTDAPGEVARKAMWARLMNKIPAVSLDNNTVSEAVQFLIEEGNIPIVLDAAGVNDKISLDAEGPTILTVIEYICDTANLNYIVTGSAVIIAKGDGQMETRIWTVSPGVVSKASEMETEESSSDAFGGIFDTDTGSDEDFTAMETEPELVRALKDYIGQEVEGSSIFLEPVSGTLVARNTVKNLELIDSYLKNLDESGDQVQVEIQARFIQISDQDLNEISFGMKLRSPWKVISAHNKDGNALVANPTDFTGALRRYSKGTRNSRYADRLSSVMNMVGVSTVGNNQVTDEVLGFFTNALTDPEVGLIFNAIDNKTNADVLSAPSVTTVSGQPRVTIKQITEVMYPEDYTVYKPAIIYSSSSQFNLLNPSNGPDISAMPGYATVESTLKEDVGIELTVSPIVADDKRTVSMDISCKTSGEIEPRTVSVYVGNEILGIDPIELDIPRFKFSEVKTQVVVADGETVVLGGMVTEALRQYKDKVPFLGDLPLIGRFFRAEGSYNEKKHLLIFVKTNIITPTGELYRDRVASKLASSLDQERADYEEGDQVTSGEEEGESGDEVEESGEETSDESAEETTEETDASEDSESTEESSEESEE
jgi:general secretion pathway protein D